MNWRTRDKQRDKDNSANNLPNMVNPILIVEDQESSAVVLKEKILKEWNVDVHIAGTLADAKELLKRHRREYLLAICDLNLPDAPDGQILDLMDKAEVKSIALTGAFGPKTRESLNKQLLVDYVLKDAVNSLNYIVNLVGRIYKNQFIKVLIADDSMSALAILKDKMVLLNFQVFTAENGADALQILEQNQDLRLVLTDYEMPQMDGFEFTVKARELLKKDQLAIIGLSSSSQADLGSTFIKSGANDFLAKPYSFEELFSRINMNIDSLEHLDFINELANKDTLTKLYNRRYFFADGFKIFSEAYLTDNKYTVAMFDVDFFKKINDTYGHDAGDEVLIRLSSLLNEKLGSHLIARIGGEEFAAVIKSGGSDADVKLLEGFRQAVYDMIIPWSGDDIRITVSVGAVTGLNEGLDQMLKTADMNLYKAKRTGRNQVIAS